MSVKDISKTRLLKAVKTYFDKVVAEVDDFNKGYEEADLNSLDDVIDMLQRVNMLLGALYSAHFLASALNMPNKEKLFAQETTFAKGKRYILRYKVDRLIE